MYVKDTTLWALLLFFLPFDEGNDISKTINDDFVNYKVNFYVELIVCPAQF